MMYKIILFLLFVVNAWNGQQRNGIDVVHLKCEYKTDPVGINESNPRLSWILKSSGNNKFQSAYQVIVSSSPENLASGIGDYWDSGKVNSAESNQIAYQGLRLSSKSKYYWKVRIWDEKDRVSCWSNRAEWTMGLLNRWDWKANWIGYETFDYNKNDDLDLPPSPFLAKGFISEKEIKKATLYITSLGLYEARINGMRVGNDFLSPGWTDYNKRIHYQMYDVSELIRKGENRIGVILSEGWYAGYVGFGKLNAYLKDKNFYGRTPLLLAQLEIEYIDGETQVVVSDGTWKASVGPILESDIQMGTRYDARMELTGWDTPKHNISEWDKVAVFPGNFARLLAHPGNPIQITDTIIPKSIIKRPGGTFIFDMGQNFAGVVKLNVNGVKGTEIKLRHGEMLHLDSTLMTENLRCARATDTYILKGDPKGEEWIPQFTFHGFQYVEITGYPGVPCKDAITGYVLGSATTPASTFECSSKMVNQLYSNIVWTQKANFIDIPTDCPQRDERLGWTGDAQIYARSSTLNMDVAAFFKKWIADLNDSQWEHGPYPNFSPTPYLRIKHDYSPAWSEAGIIVPYEIFKAYNDTRIIKTYYPNMKKLVDFLIKKSNYRYYFPENSFLDINPPGGWGDWLSIGQETPKDIIATIYFAYAAKLMAEMALAINEAADHQFYQDLFKKVNRAFIENYMDEEGKIINGHTQTAYANLIYIGMLPEDLEKKAGNYLSTLIHENDGKLSTGFLGIKQLLPALSKTGNSELAYNLLLEEEYPSWGYEIKNGATTIWERWNSFTVDHGFVSGMNSFSHYAFGAVCEWLFANMAGISSDGAGYKKIVLRPEVYEDKIDMVNASYNSIHGKIVSEWKINNGNFLWEIEIPVNTTATVCIPVTQLHSVLIDDKTPENNRNIQIMGNEDHFLIVKTGSGKYRIKSFFQPSY